MLQQPPHELLHGASLFLDFDGTLVELAASPGSIIVDDALPALLETLRQRLNGRVAIVTGRAIESVRVYLNSVGLAIAGSHGLEHASSGSDPLPVERPPMLGDAIDQLQEVQAAYPGVLLEKKPFGVALHYRQAPDAEEACRAAARDVAAATGMVVQPGKLVFELKPANADKGRALERFMEQPPFAGTRPVFIGDDLTDEDGFRAARDLGGAGVLVGDARPTNAIYRLPSVAAVMRWLEGAAETLA